MHVTPHWHSIATTLSTDGFRQLPEGRTSDAGPSAPIAQGTVADLGTNWTYEEHEFDGRRQSSSDTLLDLSPHHEAKSCRC